MKCTIILLLAACLQVSANGHAQTISVKFRELSFEKALKEVARKSGYQVFYQQAQIKQAKPVSISKENTDVREILNELFKEQPLKYEITNKTIVVSVKEEKVVKELKESAGVEDVEPLPPSTIEIRGKVVNEKGQPLASATITSKNGKVITSTKANGEFNLSVNEGDILLVSYIGYETQRIVLTQLFLSANNNNIVITLSPSVALLENVSVTVSTGYQRIPKERSTGSFDLVNNELVNRRVSTNILDRLENIASGVRFQSSISPNSSESPISVRGRSTLFSNTSPLIIVDNFPYDGDINNINPNDIENITILKDAAAASIWGAQSGNGVIVISTKRGKYNQPLKITLNTNVTITAKPNVFYSPNFLNANDFINVESLLFGQGFYDADLLNPNYPVISPVVEILAKQRAGSLSQAEAASQINSLRNLDYRNQLSRYFLRNAVNQQYALDISGGGDKSAFRAAVGYDKNIQSLVGNSYDRLTINTVNSFTPIKNLEISAGLFYSQSLSRTNNPGFESMGGKSFNTPYTQFADDNQNALPVARMLRLGYVDTARVGQLLDWRYRPLDEIRIADNQNRVYDLRINPIIRYKFAPWLSAELNFQYQRQSIEGWRHNSIETYSTRDYINRFTQISGTTLTRPVPLGGILNTSLNQIVGRRTRGQLNIDKNFGSKHHLSGIAAIESNDIRGKSSTNFLYGYDDVNGTNNSALSYTTNYPYFAGASQRISYPVSVGATTDISYSYLANVSYTYDKRYTISASGRIDQSNLFGVQTNQKSVPLWHIGANWNINKERFYSSNWLPVLKLRTTYGYNGNINKSVTAFTTANMFPNPNAVGLFNGSIANPPNPNLRWERISMFNIGIDFELKNKLLFGSLEYYHKKGFDIIGDADVAPSTGLTSFRGNLANIEGSGIDIDIRSVPVNKIIVWETSLLFSYNTDKVTKYNRIFPKTSVLTASDGGSQFVIPIVGRPVYSVYSYKWGGLNPQNGDPQGYDPSGQITTDYSRISSLTELKDLIFHGSARPTIFGALRNSVSYKNFSLSVVIGYKLGYYFRRNSVQYNSLFNSWTMHQDFEQRWQNPGDELNTNVPSMIYPHPQQSLRDEFYAYSESLVEKGDHIRLQDVQLSYNLSKHQLAKLPFDKLNLYIYVNNLGLIWTANKKGLDPDFANTIGGFNRSGYPNPRSIAFGAKFTF